MFKQDAQAFLIVDIVHSHDDLLEQGTHLLGFLFLEGLGHLVQALATRLIAYYQRR